VQALVYGVLGFALLVAACSVAVTTVDSVSERRRPLAALRAVGASPATLRAASALEAAAPLLVAGALGLVNGILASVLLARAFGAPIVVPWNDVGLLAALVGVAWIVVTAVTIPTVGRLSATESLRTT
jgi:ABC-type antimicrobial peptide transport system permease subunit